MRAKLRREAGILSMAVGLIVHADQAEGILQRGEADLIALARELLYNPNWPMDAAQKLGVDPEFALVPPAQAYWLEKRARQVKDDGAEHLPREARRMSGAGSMIRRRGILAAGAMLAAPGVWAQGAWPNRPLRMIVPYTPGGATDAMARLAAQKIGEAIGQNVVVENRPGGNGVVGTAAVHQAPADGYTLLGSASTHVLMNLVLKSTGYDPLADFQPVARTAWAPAMLAMDPKRPQRSLPEVVAAAKAAPRDWSFGVSSFGASGHLSAIAFNRATGAGIEIIPYRGTAPALTDLQGGNIQLMFDSAFALLPPARSGNVRGLAIAAHERTPLAPELPTVIETGLPDSEFASWYGVWAPRGVSPEIIERLHAAPVAGFSIPPVVQRLTALVCEPVTESLEATNAYIAADVAKNAALLRYARFEPM